MFSRRRSGRWVRADGSHGADEPARVVAASQPGWSRHRAAAGLGRAGLLLALLGVLVAGLLIEGALRRSTSKPVEPLPSRPILVGLVRPVLEKTPLAYESDYWAQLAQQVRPRLIALGASGGVGVIVEPGEALGALPRGPAPASSVESAEDGATEALDAAPRLAAVDLAEALALWRVGPDSPAAPFPRSDPAFWTTAARVAAVTLGTDRQPRIAPGYMAGSGPGGDSGRIEATVPWSGESAFAALVDIDGRLIGVGELRQGPQRWYGHQRLDRLLAALRQAGPCRPLVVRDLTEREQTAIGGRNGVVVERVWSHRIAATIEILRGDVLAEWNGRAIASENDFVSAYDLTEVGPPVRIRLVRGSRSLVATVRRPDRFCQPVIDAREIIEVFGARVVAGGDAGQSAAAPWQVVNLVEGAPAGALLVGDRILAVDGVAAGTVEARQRLARLASRPRASAVLTVERQGGVVLIEVSGR